MELQTKRRIERQFNFLTEIDKMKSIFRMNILIDKSRREDDAAHSWHIAMCALILCEYADDPVPDLGRVLEMCLVHDLVEIYAGDTFCYDAAGNCDKKERETAAADRLFALLPPEQGTFLRRLWEEFDAEETPDALFAAAVDRLQPFLLNYNTEGHTWQFADVSVRDLQKRLAPVQRRLPRLWEEISEMIGDCVRKGYLKP